MADYAADINTDNYLYREEITITEIGGEDRTNFPVKMSLTSSNFKFSLARSDGYDFRVGEASNGTRILNVWVATWNSTEEISTVWVKMPSLLAGETKTLYAYWGNPTAVNPSNLDEMGFLFAEDFTGGISSLANKWYYATTPSIINNRLRLSTGQYIETAGKPFYKLTGPDNIILAVDINTHGTYDDADVRHPSVIKESDTSYKMWYASQDTAGVWRILYTTSTDGINWADGQLNIDQGAEGTYDVNDAFGPCVIKESPTSYKIWYNGHSSTGWKILYADSTDGINWTNYQMVIDENVEGTYDTNGALGPGVIKDGAIYKIWYSGSDGTNWRIMYATSADGISWSNHQMVVDINIMTNYPGQTADDSANSYYPCVLKEGSMYYIWYASYNSSNLRMSYAESFDGINWTNHKRVLNIRRHGRYDNTHTGQEPYVIKDGSVYKFWYANSDRWGVARIMYTTSPTKDSIPEAFERVTEWIHEEGVYTEDEGNTTSSAHRFRYYGEMNHIYLDYYAEGSTDRRHTFVYHGTWVTYNGTEKGLELDSYSENSFAYYQPTDTAYQSMTKRNTYADYTDSWERTNYGNTMTWYFRYYGRSADAAPYIFIDWVLLREYFPEDPYSFDLSNLYVPYARIDHEPIDWTVYGPDVTNIIYYHTSSSGGDPYKLSNDIVDSSNSWYSVDDAGTGVGTPPVYYIENWGENSNCAHTGIITDTYIHAFYDNNYVTSTILQAGCSYTGGKIGRSFLSFDLYNDPTLLNNEIQSATLYAYATVAAPNTVKAYRVLQDIIMSQAKWNLYQTSASWNSAGCGAASETPPEDSTADRRATEEDYITNTASTPNTWYSWDLTYAVQNWFSGDWSQYGIILKATNEGADQMHSYNSSDHTTNSLRPYLEITYSEASTYFVPHVDLIIDYGRGAENSNLVSTEYTHYDDGHVLYKNASKLSDNDEDVNYNTYFQKAYPSSLDPNDDFTGTDGDPPNTDLWTVYTYDSGTIEIYNNKLSFAYGVGSSKGLTCLSKFNISGDFDVELEITATDLSEVSVLARFQVQSVTDGSAYAFMGFAYTSGGVVFWDRVQIPGSSCCNDSQSGRTGTLGVVRLVRIGSNITTYHKMDGQTSWTVVTASEPFCTHDVSVRMNIYRSDVNHMPAAEFDNFRVNSGDVVWPTNTISGYACIDFGDDNVAVGCLALKGLHGSLYGMVKNFTFAGSYKDPRFSEDSEWTVLYSGEFQQTDVWQPVYFVNENPYRYYKLNILDTHGSAVTIQEWKMYEYDESKRKMMISQLRLHPDITQISYGHDPNDDFTGNDGDSPNSDRWVTTGSPKIQGNKLRMSSSPSISATMTSVFWLIGDFDIQIDFNLVVYPIINAWTSALLVRTSDNRIVDMNLRYSGSEKKYQSQHYDGTTWIEIGTQLTNDVSGKLRLVRTGNLTECFYYNNGWVSLASDDTQVRNSDVEVRIIQGRWDEYPISTTDFDNFVVNAGTLVSDSQEIYFPKQIELYGSNNMLDWTELMPTTNTVTPFYDYIWGRWQRFSFNNTKGYYNYKLVCYGNWNDDSGKIGIAEWEMVEAQIESYSYRVLDGSSNNFNSIWAVDGTTFDEGFVYVTNDYLSTVYNNRLATSTVVSGTIVDMNIV